MGNTVQKINMKKIIDALEERVLAGESLSVDDVLPLFDAEGPDLMSLFASANRIRHEMAGDDVHLCGIVNAKSGACSENCIYCAQSASHATGVEVYSLMEEDALVEASETALQNGAQAFGIVTAWRGIKKGKALDTICNAIRRIRDEGKVIPDLSLGIIDDPEVPRLLVEAGAVEYNHNLEAAPSFYPNLCSTHTFEERVRTIKLCKDSGMRICSGGIFGLGENNEQRIELALELRNLDVDTVPLNFYNHTPGNNVNLEKVGKLSAMEALRIVSVFRFLLPSKVIKVAGGREITLGHLQPMMFLAGANSTMIGHYLTTSGRTPQDDLDMIAQCGLSVSERSCGDYSEDAELSQKRETVKAQATLAQAALVA